MYFNFYKFWIYVTILFVFNIVILFKLINENILLGNYMFVNIVTMLLFVTILKIFVI